MERGNGHIDGYFKKLGDYAAPAPPGSWEKISNRLAKEGKQRHLRWYYRAAAVAALILAVGSAYLVYTGLQGDKKQELVEAQDNHVMHPETSQKKEKTKPTIKKRLTVVSTENPAKATHAPKKPDKEEKLLALEREAPASATAREAASQTPGKKKMKSSGEPPAPETGTKIPAIPFTGNFNTEDFTSTKIDILLDGEKERLFARASTIKRKPGQAYKQLPVYEKPLTGKTNKKWQIGGEVAPLYAFVENPGGQFTEFDKKYALNESLEDAPAETTDKMLVYTGGVHLEYKNSGKISFMGGMYYSRVQKNISPGLTYYPASGRYVMEPENPSWNSIVLTAASNNTSNSLNGERDNQEPNDPGDITSNPNIDDPAKPTGNEYNTESRLKEAISNYSEMLTRNADQANEKIENSLQPNTSTINMLYQFEYMELPLLMKYSLIDRSLEVNLIGGISTHVLVQNQTISPDLVAEGLSLPKANLRPLNFGGNVRLGMAYSLFRQITVRVEPSFKYYFSSIYASSSRNPYSFGLFSGVSYHF